MDLTPFSHWAFVRTNLHKNPSHGDVRRKPPQYCTFTGTLRFALMSTLVVVILRVKTAHVVCFAVNFVLLYCSALGFFTSLSHR